MMATPGFSRDFMGSEEEEEPSFNPEAAQRIQSKILRYRTQLQTSSALFWAGHLMSLTQGSDSATFTYAECLYHDGQFHRCAHVIQQKQLEKKLIRAVQVAAKALYQVKELDEAFTVLENGQDQIDASKNLFDEGTLEEDNQEELRQILSSIYVIRGKVLEGLDNRGLAAEAFKEALKVDVTCSEAFYAITQHQMLTADEEKSLLKSLDFKKLAGDEGDLVEFLYKVRLKKYDKPADLLIPNKYKDLAMSLDLLVYQAERHYYNCDYTECFKLSQLVMTQDPYHSEGLPIYISCLVELNHPNDLFHLAHKLVEIFPEWTCAWFAVGTYYYMVGKQELARRYLSKATQLDRVFGPAWLAYGHSFALENEHDQAMAAYFKACQLMRGCHLPLLYIGVEYGLTNNAKLAERFFTQALEIAPYDPFVLHELGVTSFQNQDYKLAEKYFLKALSQVKKISGSVMSQKWESLLNNLGQTSRKLGKYEDALLYHQQALVLMPLSASTFSSIGYVYALKGELVEAVEAFHKALGIRRDDTFSTTMLNQVMEHMLQEDAPYSGFPEEIPKFSPLKSSARNRSQNTTANDSLGLTDVEMSDMSS